MNGHIKTQLKTFALVAVPLWDGTGEGGKGRDRLKEISRSG